MMPQTIRKYWNGIHGRIALNYNWPIIDQDSVVMITAAEAHANGVRFVGAAPITVSDITPHGPPYDGNHGVTFVVNVEWGSPLIVATDITVLDQKPIEVQTYVPPAPRGLPLRMQYQQTSQWCWIAVAVSINHFYNPASTWTQCRVMTTVGQKINNYPANTSACPSPRGLAAHPAVAEALANPYAIAAEGILETPGLDIDPRYIKSGGVSDPLKQMENWASNQPGNIGIGAIAAEVSAGRPVTADITWKSTGFSHCVAIAGVQDGTVLVMDPVNGTSVIPFNQFPGGYFGGATLDDFTFTKK
jgi:hypothetical protein